jgi:FKBP-type peptidyl-prolyl cis-trans isomerase FklB
MKFRNLAVVGLVLGVGSVLAGQNAKEAAQEPRKDAPAAKPSAPSELKDQKQKLGYVIGLRQGKGLKQSGIEIDVEAYARGLRDGYNGSKAQLTDDEMTAVLRIAQHEQTLRQAEASGDAAAVKNLKDGDAFLAANAKKPGVKSTASGLQYKVLKEGTGKVPRATDTVRVSYRGTLLDGTEFDNSEKHGGPASFQVGRVVPGFSEALQLMKVGSKYQIFIPSDLAYGSNPPRGSAIGSNSTLIFELELLGIE